MVHSSEAQTLREAVTRLRIMLGVALCDVLIDVCIDGRRTLINRCPAQHGDSLFLWTQAGAATWRDLHIRPLVV